MSIASTTGGAAPSSDSQEEEDVHDVHGPLSTATACAGRKRRKMRTIHLIMPYAVGLTWFLLHPIVSVVTGELKCRGSYIDESALEPGNLRVAPYPTDLSKLPKLRARAAKVVTAAPPSSRNSGLCAAISSASTLRTPFVSTRSRSRGDQSTITGEERVELISRGNVVCHTHNSSISTQDGDKLSFDAVKIEPSSPAVSSEAVVLVVNSPPNDDVGGGWSASTIHLYYLALIGRLADPNSTPWLSKTVMMVAPRQNGVGLSKDAAATDDQLIPTLQAFLDSYLGLDERSIRLPPSFSSKTLRQILVIDVEAASASSSGINAPTLRILPQGRRGVLPNLDFVFALAKAFNGGTIFKDGGISMHQGNEAEWVAAVKKWLHNLLPQGQYFQQWLSDLLRMIAFSGDLIIGPHPPHAAALDRGIDSVTIRLSLPTQQAAAGAELVQKLEQSLRALSNLHERLHHSVTQYFLPSDKKFVSNGEYTYPTVLMMLPLAARAASLALADLESFSLSVASLIGGICLGVAAWIWGTVAGLGLGANNFGLINTLIAGAYMLGLLGMNKVLKNGCNERDRRSIQFVACLFAIYAHVPIALAHASLAIPSALFWTPLLAFPSLTGDERSSIRKLLSSLIIFATWPPVSLVPRVFSEYTTYVAAVYIPLHLLFASMCLF
mmetsp:Transcript_2729/g.8013  ORF Transcript_2729/g.8013 Transcript_2729/m.8013 type:complete len:666 (+) Transcript_2729:169-2166(+)|eukprot:CAMPEP_0181045114 /NCGR_PEP_ID=MMETSP1070-20121207/13631_1 /TAXON_ID=265543 /ORGANISM="Minutocellus polymorphus, Strain NH13" /LENGTH=665 /DNA_ID=CAMNT_0023123613 /DNA_START=82 /DNA_END=2079 /DNA_ORIENTATION=-